MSYQRLIMKKHPQARAINVEGTWTVQLAPQARPYAAGDNEEKAWEAAYRRLAGVGGGVLTHFLNQRANAPKDFSLEHAGRIIVNKVLED